jgi:anaerobic magnesium-protoporphyrin IX monomethyl ester cyclase
MRVLFIYTDLGSAVGYSGGIGILSAILKRAGHQTKLLHVSDELGYPLDHDRINNDIRDYSPHLICFSVSTNQWPVTRRIGRAIKKEFGIPIIVGGAHATGDSDKVVSEPWVDIVCRGEGDTAMPEVVKCLESRRPINGIRNLLYKENSKVVREALGPWVQDLDSLPVEDHSIFNYGRIIDTRSGWAEVIVTRGCPYHCTYCFNNPLFNMYKKEVCAPDKTCITRKGYVRRRAAASVIKMLRKLRITYPNITGFTFVDDILAQEGQWFEEFTIRYRAEVSLPYACTSQPILFNRHVASMLRQSGCKVVKMGVEAGNPEIRKNVLKRNISNEKLIDVFAIATEFDLKPQSFNMIGIPGEDTDKIMETIRLNAIVKPYIVWVSTFNPYPGTELYRFCKENDMIDPAKLDKVDSYRGESVLRSEYLPPLEFKKLRVMFRWYLNANLGNEAKDIYETNIREILNLPDKQWYNGVAENMWQQRDTEIDECLRKKKVDHYVGKKYINIYWGKKYNYDLT